MLQQRRMHCVQVSKSKMETPHDSHQKVAEQMVKDQTMIDEIITAELQNLREDDIDWYNKQYDALMKEMKFYLVDQILDDSKWDLAENYERELEIE